MVQFLCLSNRTCAWNLRVTSNRIYRVTSPDRLLLTELVKWSRVLEKIIIAQVLKIFFTFYVIRDWLIMFLRTHHIIQINLAAILPSHFFKIRFNIITPSTPRCSKISPAFRIFYDNFIRMRYTLRLSLLPSFGHPSNIFRIYKTIIYLWFYMGVKLDFSH
jgi:hypothetical protein